MGGRIKELEAQVTELQAAQMELLEKMSDDKRADIAAAEYRAQIRALRRRRDDDTATIEELRNKNSALEADLFDTREETVQRMRVLDAQIAAIESSAPQQQRLTSEIEREKATNAALHDRIAQLEADVDALQDENDRLARDSERQHQAATSATANAHALETQLREMRRALSAAEDANERLSRENARAQQLAHAGASSDAEAQLREARRSLAAVEAERSRLEENAKGADERLRDANRELDDLDRERRELIAALNAARSQTGGPPVTSSTGDARILEERLREAHRSLDVLEKERTQLISAVNVARNQAADLEDERRALLRALEQERGANDDGARNSGLQRELADMRNSLAEERRALREADEERVALEKEVRDLRRALGEEQGAVVAAEEEVRRQRSLRATAEAKMMDDSQKAESERDRERREKFQKAVSLLESEVEAAKHEAATNAQSAKDAKAVVELQKTVIASLHDELDSLRVEAEMARAWGSPKPKKRKEAKAKDGEAGPDGKPGEDEDSDDGADAEEAASLRRRNVELSEDIANLQKSLATHAAMHETNQRFQSKLKGEIAKLEEDNLRLVEQSVALKTQLKQSIAKVTDLELAIARTKAESDAARMDEEGRVEILEASLAEARAAIASAEGDAEAERSRWRRLVVELEDAVRAKDRDLMNEEASVARLTKALETEQQRAAKVEVDIQGANTEIAALTAHREAAASSAAMALSKLESELHEREVESSSRAETIVTERARAAAAEARIVELEAELQKMREAHAKEVETLHDNIADAVRHGEDSVAAVKDELFQLQNKRQAPTEEENMALMAENRALEEKWMALKTEAAAAQSALVAKMDDEIAAHEAAMGEQHNKHMEVERALVAAKEHAEKLEERLSDQTNIGEERSSRVVALEHEKRALTEEVEHLLRERHALEERVTAGQDLAREVREAADERIRLLEERVRERDHKLAETTGRAAVLHEQLRGAQKAVTDVEAKRVELLNQIAAGHTASEEALTHCRAAVTRLQAEVKEKDGVMASNAATLARTDTLDKENHALRASVSSLERRLHDTTVQAAESTTAWMGRTTVLETEVAELRKQISEERTRAQTLWGASEVRIKRLEEELAEEWRARDTEWRNQASEGGSHPKQSVGKTSPYRSRIKADFATTTTVIRTTTKQQ